MNSEKYRAGEKSAYLEKIFPFLAEYGAENITIRELCKGTGIVQGNLYYRFADKTNIVCEAAGYGLEKITTEIGEYVLAHTDDLRGLFASVPDEINRYKKELCFVHRLTASPVYGEKIRVCGDNLSRLYDEYARRLSEKLNCDEQTVKPLVYLFASCMLDYVIWEEKEKAQMQLAYICSVLQKSRRR